MSVLFGQISLMFIGAAPGCKTEVNFCSDAECCCFAQRVYVWRGVLGGYTIRSNVDCCCDVVLGSRVEKAFGQRESAF